MLKIEPYLFFDGNCAEVMRFYERALGGTLQMMTHAQSPTPQQSSPGSADRILHACLTVGDQSIMASDTMPGQSYQGIRGVSISLFYDVVADAKRAFTALSDGGKVQMPLAETFWAETFGMLEDRFGTAWMISAGAKKVAGM